LVEPHPRIRPAARRSAVRRTTLPGARELTFSHWNTPSARTPKAKTPSTKDPNAKAPNAQTSTDRPVARTRPIASVKSVKSVVKKNAGFAAMTAEPAHAGEV